MMLRKYLIPYEGKLAQRHVSFIGARKARLELIKQKGWDENKVSIAEELQ